jgi:uncharacterized membrane protein YbhN (UPF0104 family)
MAPRSDRRRAWLGRLLALAVSLGGLAALHAGVGAGELRRVLAGADLAWLAAGVLALAPLTLLTAWRFVQVVPARRGVSLGESTRLVLAASALNLVLPSKLGDLAKAMFLQSRTDLRGPLPLAAVFFEKASDLFGLLAWCLVGLVLLPAAPALAVGARALVGLAFVALGVVLCSRGLAARALTLVARALPDRFGGPVARLGGAWSELLAGLWGPGGRGPVIVLASLALWLLHLVQIWLLARSLAPRMPLLPTVALVPLAIVAGLLPLTVAGVGTRDAALVAVLAGYLPATTAAALGVLTTLRYVLPALFGLPFLGDYASRRSRSTAGRSA